MGASPGFPGNLPPAAQHVSSQSCAPLAVLSHSIKCPVSAQWLLETIAVAIYGNTGHFPSDHPQNELGERTVFVEPEESKYWHV